MEKLKMYWLNNNVLKEKFSFFSLIFILLLIVLTILNNLSANILSWDVFGYYLYLPSFFIYNDLAISNISWVHDIVSVYHNTDTLYQFGLSPLGNNVNQYSMGIALFYLPFFLLGHLLALITDYPSDGFSLPYQLSILLSGFFYCVLGLVFLRKILLYYFSDKTVAWVLVLVCLGTNYFHVQTQNTVMPHNYLFALYAILFWSTIKWYEKITFSNSIFLGLIIGLITLSRPTEFICVLIPIFYGVFSLAELKEKKLFFWQKRRFIFLIMLVAFLVGLPQLIYWKVLAGDFFYYSYLNKGEGLDLISPHLINVLVSFRKGWLIYTPIMIFSIIGFYYLYKSHKKLFLPIGLFFIFNLYLISSWSNWWFADSFSQRSLMQSYAVLAIPMCAFITSINNLKKRIVKIVVYVFMGGLVFLNLFQTWQINHGIINGSRMTKEYYFSIFGQTTPPTKQQGELLLINRSTTAKESFTDSDKYSLSYTEILDFEEEGENNILVDNSHSGRKVFKLDKDHSFSKNISKTFKELTSKDHAWIKVSLWVFPSQNWKDSKLSLITTFDYKGSSYKYRGLNTEENTQLIPNQWNKIEVDYLTPEPRSIKDKFSAYAWLRGEKEILIDDLSIEVYTKNDN